MLAGGVWWWWWWWWCCCSNGQPEAATTCVRVSSGQGAAVPCASSCKVRGTLLKKCRMLLLLLDEFCRFMAAVKCAAPTRDALLIEWGWTRNAWPGRKSNAGRALTGSRRNLR
jgi:hypothetical protein